MTMAKKITLKELGAMLEHVIKHMLTKEDGEKFATKDQIVALHMQVNGIENDIKTTKQYKLVTRVADLEVKAFGRSRD